MSTPAHQNTPTVEELWAPAPKSYSFDGTPPIKIRGIVVRQEVGQQTDIRSREPLFWRDGRPQRKVVVFLTDSETGALTALHLNIPSGQFTAMRDALEDCDAVTLAVGDEVELTYTAESDTDITGAPIAKGLNKRKLFEAVITRGGSDTSEPPF